MHRQRIGNQLCLPPLQVSSHASHIVNAIDIVVFAPCRRFKICSGDEGVRVSDLGYELGGIGDCGHGPVKRGGLCAAAAAAIVVREREERGQGQGRGRV